MSVGGKLFELMPFPGAKERSEKTRAFFSELIGALSDILAPYRHIDSMSLEDSRLMARSVMRAINAIVYKYHCHGGDCGDLQINSCYMLPILRHEFTPELLATLRFVDRKRDLAKELRGVLKIEQWAEPVAALPTDLCLPVEHPGSPAIYKNLLFGAPRAFEKGHPQLIDDTLKPTRHRRAVKPWVDDGPATPGRLFMQKELSEPVVNEIIDYFRQHQDHVRSFGSLALTIPAEDAEYYPAEYKELPLAVLNIQSNQPRLFGKAGSLARNLLPAMLPMLGVLARYISRIRMLKD
jgi:hypothetical protein